MTRPPPSPQTNPSRAASKGRDALAGSSLRVDMAFIWQNPAMQSGMMMASAPPAIMTSASPRWMIFVASPMAWLPVAHAVTTDEFGPLAPKRMEIRPDAMLMISMGMKNGETRSGRSTRVTRPRLLVLFDVGDGVSDGDDLLGILVGNLETELLLERHHQLDGVEGIGPEVLDELGVRGHLVLFDAELLADDFLHPLLDRFRHEALLPSNEMPRMPPARAGGPVATCTARR